MIDLENLGGRAHAAPDAEGSGGGRSSGLVSGLLGVHPVHQRAYAVAHPHLYRLMNYQPLRRDLLPGGLETRAAQPLAEAAGYDEARARAMWAFAHGMVSLEIDGRFPPRADLDEAWRAGLAAFAPSAALAPREPQAGHITG